MVPLAGALGMLAVAFVLGRTGRAPGDAATAPVEDTGYGYVASDVTVEQTDADGRPEYEIFAREVQQQANADPVMARGLELYYDPRDAAGNAQHSQRWTLRADEAQLPTAGGPLQLRGNVAAEGRPGAATEPVQVRTDSLDYDMRSRLLTTPSLVTLHWAGRELSGVGLRADLAQGTIDLSADVHGRAAP